MRCVLVPASEFLRKFNAALCVLPQIPLLLLLSYDEDPGAPLAFAKLHGRCLTDLAAGGTGTGDEFTAYITKLPAKLGRKVDEGDISLSKSKSVSRHHATLLLQDDHIEIRCEGKNGLTVNSKQVESGQQVRLQVGDAVKIGCYCFYFCEGQRQPN